MNDLTRRNLLIAGASLAVAPRAFAQRAPRKRVVRFIHMTDLHLTLERETKQTVSHALRRINREYPDAKFIFIGGDLVMDAMDANQAQATRMYRSAKEVLSVADQPIYYCLGNHDVFGWGLPYKAPQAGKTLFRETFGIDRLNYQFRQGGWRFIVLDSISEGPKHRGVKSYKAKITENGLRLLKEAVDLPGEHPPTLCLLHIPILSSVWQPFYAFDTEITPLLQIENNQEVFQLLQRLNCKLVLQGHLHTVESMDYLGITFKTCGSIAGSWWKGKMFGQFDQGFTVVDLFDNQTFHTRYVPLHPLRR